MTETHDKQNMWYPGLDYKERLFEYQRRAGNIPREEFIELVQNRVDEDGQWAIDNNLVGTHADVMRAMMKWARTESNILQCLAANLDKKPTVDWICRELATAAKWIGGSNG